MKTNNVKPIFSLTVLLLLFCIVCKVNCETPPITIAPVKPPITIGPVKPAITIGTVNPSITIGTVNPSITIVPVTPPIMIGPVDGDGDGFEKEDVNAEEAAVEEAVEAEVEGRPMFKNTETIEKLKEDLTIEFTASTGKDWGDLSSTVLTAAWDNNGNKTEISVMELMVWFDKVGGEDRLHLLRILELMDENMNGQISKEEFIYTYSGPMASPDKAIELLHRVNDYDGDGFISIWESLTQILITDGINRNIYDKYKEALYENEQKDANMDKKVSFHEFTNYMVWQMNIGIGAHLEVLPHQIGS